MILNFLESDYVSSTKIVAALKEHEILNCLYSKPLGGIDNMTLEDHTTKVMEIFEKYFERKVNLILKDTYFKLLLALHDLGKPKAVAERRQEKQHDYTVEIITTISKDFRLACEIMFPIKTLIAGDPIGRHLNKKHEMPLEDSLRLIRNMANQLSVTVREIWSTLLVYYQCDVSGYDSLRKKVFVTDAEGSPIYFGDHNRFQFQDTEELEKFDALEDRVLQG
jgi:hypothetical protein